MEKAWSKCHQELTSLFEAEAGDRTGPLGALWGGERCSGQSIISGGKVPLPLLQATATERTVLTENLEDSTPHCSFEAWSSVQRRPVGPPAERSMSWRGGGDWMHSLGSLKASPSLLHSLWFHSPLYLRCCRIGMTVSRGMLWARKSCQAQYCSKVSQSRL